MTRNPVACLTHIIGSGHVPTCRRCVLAELRAQNIAAMGCQDCGQPWTEHGAAIGGTGRICPDTRR